MELNEQNRSRLLWILVAVTAAYGMTNVLVFYTTESFGPVWFASGLLVYGALFTAAVFLSLVDTGVPLSREAESPEDVAKTAEEDRPSLELLDHETVYATRTGRVLRTRFRSGDRERSLLFAVTGDEVLPVNDLEERLDRLDVPDARIDSLREVEDSLDRRSSASPVEALQPSSVHVEILDRETLYRTQTGRVERVEYETAGRRRERLFALTSSEVVAIHDVEARLDGVDVDELPVEAERRFQEALAAREDRSAIPVNPTV